jgi:uncharacterized protein YoxC
MAEVTLEFIGRAVERLQEDNVIIIGMLRQLSARIDSIDEQLAGMRHQLDGLTRRESRLDRQFDALLRRVDERGVE